ncbi:MAG: FAD-binding oxidoreductase [Candidatus Hermodarchaeota archaeon]
MLIKTEKTSAVPLSDIRKIQGQSRITEFFPGYLMDESKFSTEEVSAELLFFPKNENELAAVMKECNQKNILMTISGARTGIVGSAVPLGGAVISLEKLDKILSVNYDEKRKKWFVRAQAGVTLKDLNDNVINKKFFDLRDSSNHEQKELIQKFKDDPVKYFYPVDPTEMTAHLGGSIATNASGARSFKYGATRPWVRRIRVVLPTCEILDIPRGKYFASPDNIFTIVDSSGQEIVLPIPDYIAPDIKNASGLYSKPQMDLIDLFIGSEGILGVISEAEVYLTHFPRNISLVVFFPCKECAIEFVNDVRKKKGEIDTEFLEFMDEKALDFLRKIQEFDLKNLGTPYLPPDAKAAIFMDLPFDEEKGVPQDQYRCLSELLEKHGTSMNKTWVGYETREIERIKHFRHALPENVNALIAERKKTYSKLHKLSTDIAVPDEHLSELWEYYQTTLEEAKIEWVAFGHIGQNHIHVNILPRDEEEVAKGKELYDKFAKKAVELSGTVSAEHGIGKIKKDFLKIMFRKEDIEEMRRVKRILDPKWLLNRGNIFD